jgi:hypothetical protein
MRYDFAFSGMSKALHILQKLMLSYLDSYD